MSDSREFDDLWYHSEDGLRLYARDYARAQTAVGAPVLLCLHGLTRNSSDFASLAAHLGTRFRVLVADQRGRGRSAYDPDPSQYLPPVYVRDMFTLLDAQALDDVVLVGTSMGGLMAFMMAAMQPRRFRALVINDIGPEVDPRGLARIKAYVGKAPAVADWEQAVAQSRVINGAAFPDFSDEQWLEFTRALYRDEAGIPVLAYDQAISQPLAEEQANAVPPDLWPVMEAIRAIPMLLIRGAHSDILSSDCVRKMRQCNAELQVAEIANRGHAPTLNEAASRRAIDGFLATL